MREKVKVSNENESLVLYINSSKKDLVVAHIRLQNKVKEKIEAGEAYSPASINECILDLFVVLFGETGAKQLLDFYGGRHDDAFNAISYYYGKKLIPRLKRAKRKFEMRD